MTPLRIKKIILEIRNGKWVDRRKWPKNKITVSHHNDFFRGLATHQRMAILKAVKFDFVSTYPPAQIDTKYSFPNADEIAILEEAGMIFLEDHEYLKRKFCGVFNELGT